MTKIAGSGSISQRYGFTPECHGSATLLRSNCFSGIVYIRHMSPDPTLTGIFETFSVILFLFCSAGALLPHLVAAVVDCDGGGGRRLLPHLHQEPGDQALYCRSVPSPPSPPPPLSANAMEYGRVADEHHLSVMWIHLFILMLIRIQLITLLPAPHQSGPNLLPLVFCRPFRAPL
jgi:hypothetical protein